MVQGKTFYRPARAYPPVLPKDDIVISAPPVIQPAQAGALTWLQYALPALGGLGSLVFIFAYHSSPLMIIAGVLMAFCSLGSGVIMGIIHLVLIKKQRRQQRTSYLERLSHLRKR